MRRIIVAEFMSLDGVVEAPGGEDDYRHTGWTFDIDMDPQVYETKTAELSEAEGLLLGRRTWEAFAGAWPAREEHEGPEQEFALRFGDIPKHVVTSTLTDVGAWRNSHILGSGLDAVRELRETEGGPLMVNGSIELTHALSKADLVDTWHLLVWPVVLGSGRRIFPADAEEKRKLTLRESRTYSNGVQFLQLDRVR